MTKILGPKEMENSGVDFYFMLYIQLDQSFQQERCIYSKMHHTGVSNL